MRETATSMNHELESDRRDNSTRVEQLGNTEDESKAAILQLRPIETSGSDPRSRLKTAAAGKVRLSPDDIEALVVDHIVRSDEQAVELGETCRQLVAFLFSKERPDTEATLGLIKDISSLSKANGREMRHSIKLLAHLRRTTPPTVRLINNSGSLTRLSVSSGRDNDNAMELGE